MKFIADAMLGRLAKWMRFLGLDILYYPDIDDRQLIRLAREQERAVLTRDTRLIKNKGGRDYIFIKSDHILEQLHEIKDRLNLHDVSFPARCAVCNGELLNISLKRDIKEYVPDFIYHNFSNFLKCADCGKVYWEGTHQRKIKEKISEILLAQTDSMRR